MVKILVLESQPLYRKAIINTLRAAGYEVLGADKAEELPIKEATLIVGDVEDGGLELCAKLREEANAVPFIALAETMSRLTVRHIFRAGADGYMQLPVDEEELTMRVRNLLWRCHIVEDSVLRFGDCVLRSADLSVKTPGETIELRRMEFMLLEKLLSYPGKIFTRARLLDDLWGYESESGPRTVDTHIRRLRKKLKMAESIRIQTVRGLGYRAVLSKASKKTE